MFLQEFGEMTTFDLLSWINDARLTLDVLKASEYTRDSRFAIRELENQIELAIEEYGVRQSN